MHKRMTITLDEAVYEGLYRTVDSSGIATLPWMELGVAAPAAAAPPEADEDKGFFF